MKNDLSKAIDNFTNSGFKILELWDGYMDNLDGYPFDESFDEVMVKLDKWLMGYKDIKEGKEDLKPKLVKLDGLVNTYDQIVDRLLKKEIEGVLELPELEKEFNSQIKNLTHAINSSNGVVSSAKKVKGSTNAIMVGSETISYRDFFNEYEPYKLHNSESDIAEQKGVEG